MNKARAIIADDEQNLLQYLQQMLAKLWPELEVVGTASNGAEALAMIRDEEPDIAFLDIRMPVLTGLQVANRIKGECQVVFITAYDEYALEAFDAAAIDYLLKPIEEPRLQVTIERLQQSLSSSHIPTEQWQAVVNHMAGQPGQGSGNQFLSWIRAGDHEATRVIAIEDVLFFKAEDKYTTVVTKEKEYLIRKPIKELVVELDPDRFWQIHRATIANVAEIDTVQKNQQGGYQLTLKQGKHQLSVSRRYAHLFKQM